jgi:superfamily I DNA/RNA helicase
MRVENDKAREWYMNDLEELELYITALTRECDRFEYLIGQIVEAEGCPYSEIAVIYTLENPDPVREPLPISLKIAFSSRGILCMWASESYRSKQTCDITTNSVTVSTIHSMKGFDFSCVLLIGLDFLEPRGWAEEQINNLVYVGMARARYQLYILYIRINLLIKELSDCSFFR